MHQLSFTLGDPAPPRHLSPPLCPFQPIPSPSFSLSGQWRLNSWPSSLCSWSQWLVSWYVSRQSRLPCCLSALQLAEPKSFSTPTHTPQRPSYTASQQGSPSAAPSASEWGPPSGCAVRTQPFGWTISWDYPLSVLSASWQGPCLYHQLCHQLGPALDRLSVGQQAAGTHLQMWGAGHPRGFRRALKFTLWSPQLLSPALPHGAVHVGFLSAALPDLACGAEAVVRKGPGALGGGSRGPDSEPQARHRCQGPASLPLGPAAPSLAGKDPATGSCVQCSLGPSLWA